MQYCFTTVRVVRRTHYNVLFIHTLPNVLIFITLCFIFKDDADLYNSRLGLEEELWILI